MYVRVAVWFYGFVRPLINICTTHIHHYLHSLLHDPKKTPLGALHAPFTVKHNPTQRCWAARHSETYMLKRQSVSSWWRWLTALGLSLHERGPPPINGPASSRATALKQTLNYYTTAHWNMNTYVSLLKYYLPYFTHTDKGGGGGHVKTEQDSAVIDMLY